jgi:hypothetical protein
MARANAADMVRADVADGAADGWRLMFWIVEMMGALVTGTCRHILQLSA